MTLDTARQVSHHRKETRLSLTFDFFRGQDSELAGFKIWMSMRIRSPAFMKLPWMTLLVCARSDILRTTSAEKNLLVLWSRPLRIGRGGWC